MKHVKSILFVLLFTGLLVSVFIPITNPMTNNELVHEPSQNSVLSYETHTDIYIVGDDNLNAIAVSESWEGDGSSETPFLIQGYEISEEMELIYIRDTTLHFEILDCNLTDTWAAIYLENVTNGYIENCLIVDAYNGIYLYNVTGIDVVGCDISGHPTEAIYGIYMDEAIDCSIQSCVIQGVTGSEAGIFGQYSEGITLFNNTVFEFDWHGIFFGGCYDLDILNNTLYWNEGSGSGAPECGIQIVDSELADIIGNNITENMDNGITIHDTDNVTIIQNHIVDNWIHGIFVEFSDYCIIQDNWIEGNGDGMIGPPGPLCGVFIGASQYCQIIGNDFWWNAINSITLIEADFCYIFDNYLNHSFDSGMYILDSFGVTIEENEIYNADSEGEGPACGIFMEMSDSASLIHNIIGHNSENGITIVDSYEGEVIGNTIFDSEYCGIYMVATALWNISHNVIYDNGAPGIVMDTPTADNFIYYNDIGWCGEYLVADDGLGNYWNYTTIGNWYSDYTGTGTYTIPGSASEIDYYPSMSLYCGVTSPGEYQAGTTGNTMTWNSSALNPGTYELLIDDVSQGHVVWDGGAIAADVDGLAVGVYNVTLIAYHVSGHWLANQSTLTVVDTLGPVWSATPVDQVLEYNEPLSYQLEATDPSGISSWAVNNTANFTISSAGLITNATTLTPGVYYLEITVTDEHSNSISVTIMITVNEPVPPTPPFDSALMLAIGGIGAGVVIILVVIVFKKKGT